MLPSRAVAARATRAVTTTQQTTIVQTTIVQATTVQPTNPQTTTAPATTVPTTTVTTTVQTPARPPQPPRATQPAKCPPGSADTNLCEVVPGPSPPSKPAPAPAAKPSPSSPSSAVASPSTPPASALPGYPPLTGQLSQLTTKALSEVINLFPVPPFLLPIYQAAASDYGVPWPVLAAINEVETDYGRNLSISSAGAVGWMQFLPSSWARYGLDADGRGSANPYDPIDAIFAAARYLAAAGAGHNLSGAIFAYNHADWYVNSVLLRAKLLQLMPQDVVDGLTGLMEASFPVAGHLGPAAVEAPSRIRIAGKPAVRITAPWRAPVIAVADGRVVAVGDDAALGKFVTIEDSYGNRFTYSGLGGVERVYPVLKPQVQSAVRIARELAPALAPRTPAPATAVGATASATTSSGSSAESDRHGPRQSGYGATSTTTQAPALAPAALAKERLFADPLRPASYAAGGWLQLQVKILSYAIGTALQIGAEGPSDYFSEPVRLRTSDFTLAALRPGTTVVAGTVLGHVGSGHRRPAGIAFQTRPAGASSPIDPVPIIAEWELLGRLTAGRAALVGAGETGAYGTRNVSLGQLLLASKPALERAVLSDSRVTILGCGRRDIHAGRVDRRVLAVIEYLSYTGFAPSITGLVCGEPAGSGGQLGTVADISELDGKAVAGNQRDGGVVDVAIRALLQLEGVLRPQRIVSTRRYASQSVTTALPDAKRLEIDFSAPSARGNGPATQSLDGGAWKQLMARLAQLDGQPGEPSPFAAPVSQAQ